MSTYQTVVVGTDGSDWSMRAVDRAGEIAAETNAKLIIATGYFSQPDDSRAAAILKDESYMLQGNAPIYAILRDARERAKAAGAKNIEERSVKGAPVHVLVEIAEEANADLLVVGDVGLSAVLGRLFSVPGNVASKAKADVLIVHTTG